MPTRSLQERRVWHRAPVSLLLWRPVTDFTHIHHELTTDRNSWIQLLWEEYRGVHYSFENP